MIDDRFAPEAFARAAENVDALTELQDLLQGEIESLVMPAVAEAVDQIVQQLNGVGHGLILEADRTDGTAVCYAQGSRLGPDLRLWLCFDGTATVGYAGIKTPR
jgi:hypothetical protein